MAEAQRPKIDAATGKSMSRLTKTQTSPLEKLFCCCPGLSKSAFSRFDDDNPSADFMAKMARAQTILQDTNERKSTMARTAEATQSTPVKKLSMAAADAAGLSTPEIEMDTVILKGPRSDEVS